MKYLFLGLMYDQDNETEYIKNSKIGLQAAANTFQYALVNGFIENGVDISVLNSIPVGNFPKYYSKLFICSSNWEYKNIKCKNIGFLNLPILKQISRKIKFINQIVDWIREDDQPKTIVVYSLYVPFLQAIKYIKKIFKHIKISVVVTDLYGKNGLSDKNRFRSFLMRQYQNKIDRLTKYIDSFTVLTKQMIKPLNIGNRPYTVVEGIYSENNNMIDFKKSEKKVILYTGTLNYQFGINNLLDAFSLIDCKDYELLICGDGSEKNKVIELAKSDSRIKYLGFLPKNEILKLQGEATVLINPRQNNGEYTKYSFPSKTIEYLASATPLIAYKLDGIPDEYDDYIEYVEGNSVDDLKNKIIDICEMDRDKLIIKGNKNRNFIINNKNARYQTKKILDILNF